MILKQIFRKLANLTAGLNNHKNSVPLQRIEAMFERMANKSGWNVDGDLLWGYFFTDHSKFKLEKAAGELEQLGYTIAELRKGEEEKVYILHIEEVTTHTPQSLNDRNEFLVNFARQHNIEVYDGYDVGLVKQNPKL